MDSASNRVASVVPAGGGSQNWTLDASGSLLDDGAGLSLTYDASGRMASSTQGSFSTAYAVNAMGQRTYKEVATSPGPTLTKEFSIYDEQGRLLGRYDGAGAALEELVYLDGFRPVATVRGSDIDRVLTDHLGTPRKVLDPTGSLLWSWEAKEPFGNSAPVGVGGFAFDLRFPGQILDSETGLVHNGFREYHPGAGRYVESDPLGLGGGVNTYGYASSNPGSLIDPSGLRFGVGFDAPAGQSALARIALSPSGAGLISLVEKDPRTLNLILGDADFHLNSYWDSSNPRNAGYSYIYWSPNGGVRCVKTGEILSPAVQLAHEMQHFLQNANPSEAAAMQANRLDWTSWFWNNYLRGSVGAYGNELEYDAIMVEQRVARDLGEFVRKSGFETIDGVPYYEAVNYDH